MRLLLLLLLLLPVSVYAEKAEIIGCIQTKTLETKEPINGTCFYGQNWQNIMLPPKRHLKIWIEVFQDYRKIVNRLPIVNFESGFDEYAENYRAIGYVQTLKKYNIDTDIKTQLEWMRNRQESQKDGNCSHRYYSEDDMIRCLYNRHYGMTTQYNWYSNKLMVAREYYFNYFNKVTQ